MFRIGEFSKLTQAPGSLLRYYDKIGLFKPARLDKWTGYRYYSAKQLPILNRILALKELGLTLGQIRRLVDDDLSADEIRGMLTLKKAQVEQSIEEEMARLRHIEARLEQIDAEGSLDEVGVVVKSVPARPYLSLQTRLSTFADGYQLMGEMLRLIPAEIGQKNLQNLTIMLIGELFTLEDIDVAMGFTLNKPLNRRITLPSQYVLSIDTLPAVETMITTVRVGNSGFGNKCYAALSTWIENNDYRITGPGREVFIVPPLPGKEDEMVVEVQYPIEPADYATTRIN